MFKFTDFRIWVSRPQSGPKDCFTLKILQMHCISKLPNWDEFVICRNSSYMVTFGPRTLQSSMSLEMIAQLFLCFLGFSTSTVINLTALSDFPKCVPAYDTGQRRMLIYPDRSNEILIRNSPTLSVKLLFSWKIHFSLFLQDFTPCLHSVCGLGFSSNN